MADLTRFDFHAMKFLHSEHVQRMKAEEVGAYILLLVEAWACGKEASLPNDIPYLNRIARCTITKLVLDRFDEVDTQWGRRLRNETLYNEWRAAEARSESGRISVEKRWQKERNIPPYVSRNTNVLPTYISANTQAVSDHIISNQIKKEESANFKNIATRYRSAFGIKHAKDARTREAYQKVCNEHTEDLVLELFGPWAEENNWVSTRGSQFALRNFFDEIPELLEYRAQDAVKAEKESVKVDAIAAAEQAGHEQFLREQAEHEERFREEREAAKMVESNPDALFGG